MSNIIGKRLAQLRNELACPGESTWSQGRLSEETGLTPNQIARVEQASAGSIETFVTLLSFYHRKGYNLTWILLPDNTTISKMALSETAKSVDAYLVVERLGELKEMIGKQVDSLVESFNS